MVGVQRAAIFLDLLRECKQFLEAGGGGTLDVREGASEIIRE